MILYACPVGTVAARSEGTRGCLGMVLTRVDGVQVHRPDDVDAIAHDCLSIVLHFNDESGASTNRRLDLQGQGPLLIEDV